MKIYVGNMSFNTTQDMLQTLFTNYGEVNEVAVINDRETGRPRGFAFVTMNDAGQARAAIDGLNGKDVDGRALNVTEAKPRESGNANRGGNSRGW